MSVIIIRRDKAFWADIARAYVVLVDGKERGSVSNGGELEVPVEAGEHTVQLKIDWCRSPKMALSLATEERLVLECGPSSSPLLALLYITLWRNKYIWLRRHVSVAR